MISAYKSALRNVLLWGPTRFAPVIKVVSGYAAKAISQNNQKYYILLIITDGIVTDMRQTIDAIVEASYLPLSIVIVGLGDANFDNMNRLDSDKKKLQHSNGKSALRDIVQFVPFRHYAYGDFKRLANDTLIELPDQFVNYYKMKGIVPNTRVDDLLDSSYMTTPQQRMAAMNNWNAIVPLKDANKKYSSVETSAVEGWANIRTTVQKHQFQALNRTPLAVRNTQHPQRRASTPVGMYTTPNKPFSSNKIGRNKGGNKITFATDL